MLIHMPDQHSEEVAKHCHLHEAASTFAPPVFFETIFRSRMALNTMLLALKVSTHSAEVFTESEILMPNTHKCRPHPHPIE